MTPDLDPNTDLSFTRTLAVPRPGLGMLDPAEAYPAFLRAGTAQGDVGRHGRACRRAFQHNLRCRRKEMENKGVYLDVVHGEKLVFTDTYTEGWKPAPEPFMTAILLLADAPGGGTSYTAIARHRNPIPERCMRRWASSMGGAQWRCSSRPMPGSDAMTGRFATLTFERMSAPVETLWQAWSAPAARAVWAAPSPAVTVEFLEADTRVGGREDSLCKVAGQPDIRSRPAGWSCGPPAAA